MIIRLVRMTFAPSRLDEFEQLFAEASPRIRAFPGCEHLELWKTARHDNILTTYSHWRDADALRAYRKSDLFATTWAKTKPLFADRPTAESFVRHVGPVEAA